MPLTQCILLVAYEFTPSGRHQIQALAGGSCFSAAAEHQAAGLQSVQLASKHDGWHTGVARGCEIAGRRAVIRHHAGDRHIVIGLQGYSALREHSNQRESGRVVRSTLQ